MVEFLHLGVPKGDCVVKSSKLRLLAFLTGSHSTLVIAAPVSWAFTGITNYVEDDGGPFTGLVHQGSPLSGIVTFDPAATTDSVPDDPKTGLYWFSDSLSLSFEIDGFSSIGQGAVNRPLSPSHITLRNDVIPITVPPGQAAPTDAFDLTVPMLLAGSPLAVQLDLRDDGGLMLSNDALPLTPPYIDGWGFDTAQFYLYADGLTAEALVTSFTVVPEPEYGVLLVLCATMIFVRREPWAHFR